MYKIVITKIEEVAVTKREYQRIADTGNKSDNGAVYGYVACECVQERETKVLEQGVETLDLPAVIKAVNKI